MKNFREIPSVLSTDTSYALPCAVNRSASQPLRPENATAWFQKSRAIVVVGGEGGVGKTGLACKVATWAGRGDILGRPILPIWLGGDAFNATGSRHDRIIAFVADQLTIFGDCPRPLRTEFTRALCERGRVLLIADRYSELTSDTQACFAPGVDNPCAHILYTTRELNRLATFPHVLISPSHLEGSEISVFLEHEIKLAGKRRTISDSELHQACATLVNLVGDRPVTILLAKLYAQLVVAPAAMENVHDIPGLILAYVNKLNVTTQPKGLTTALVHRALKALAWLVVRPEYVPGAAPYEDAAEALSFSTDPPEVLSYLEERVQLIEVTGPRHSIRFRLDPIAEYLAAMQLVEMGESSTDEWLRLMRAWGDQETSQFPGRDFAVAVKECLYSSAVVMRVNKAVLDSIKQHPLGRPAAADT
jgi:hypothetical protein